ncbi:hypothetical protein ACOSQ4_028266 [Xanthoceras sorbifolium]
MLQQQANVHQATTFYATPEVVCDPAWYTDSGATNHVTSNLNNLHLPTKYKGNDRLAVGNGQQLQISHTGFLKEGLYKLDMVSPPASTSGHQSVFSVHHGQVL